MNPTEQSHQTLRNILLNGRILLNGMPLTANEVGSVIQGEQMLYEKASGFDKAEQLAADKANESKEPNKPNIIPIKEPPKKEE